MTAQRAGIRSRRPRRLLVVEDDAGLRANLAELLRDCGFEVIVAEDGARALEILGEAGVDLVLTDYRMPGLTGLRLVEEVKRQHPRIPCILMSAFGDGVTRVEGVRHGAAGYLEKPFEAAEMVGLVEMLLPPGGT